MMTKFDVIDACSAPGNKTIQMSEYCGNESTIFACEKSEKRIKLLEKTIKKHNTTNIVTKCMDFL